MRGRQGGRSKLLPCVVFAVVFSACPEAKKREGGAELVYAKPEFQEQKLRDGGEARVRRSVRGGEARSIRLSVEKRLARLKLKANIYEDSTSLRVRLLGPSADAEPRAAFKAAMATRGVVELCPLDEGRMEGWCKATDAGVTIAPPTGQAKGCALEDHSRKALEALSLVKDAPRVLLEERPAGTFVARAVGECEQPRVVKAMVPPPTPEQPFSSVSITFDAEGKKDVATLTRENKGKLLLMVLDGEVKVAATVYEEITGGTIVLSLGSGTGPRFEEANAIANALEAGPLPEFVLKEERVVGAP